MKKFFSLLCATLLVFSASAAPVAQKAEIAKKAVAVEQVQKVQFEKAQPAMKVSFENAQPQNFNQLNAAPAVKVINQKAAMQPKQMVAKHLDKAQRAQLHQQAANVARAPKRVAQSEELTITESEVDDTYADGEYDLYLLTSIGGETRQICIYLYNSSLEGSYDINNYNIDPYSCVIGPNYDPYYEMSACSVTITSLGDDQYSCECSFTIETGSYTFSTTLSYAPHVPQVYEITASDFSMVDYGTDMYMTALDAAGNKFFFDVYYTGSFELGKTYTLADMDPDYSWYNLASGGGNAYTEASITVTEDQDGLLHVVAAVVLNNGDSYSITYDEKAFEPSGVQIPLNGTELSGSYKSSYYMYIYTAKVGENEIQLAFDATAEQATYTKDQLIADYCYYASPDYSTYVEFVKAASDFTITTTEKTKTLTGSIYADNGDEYILNLVYEKPDAKEISINVKDATLTNKTVAGFWTIDGQTADKNNSFNIYFISKALQGTWTDVEQFDAYSTWVSDKSSGSNVYYENLSEVNLISAIVEDSLVVEGTLSLADYNGNLAIVTVHISTPFTQEWGEWADFAPFDFNTGKYSFSAAASGTQTNIPVQVRKDNTGLKQFKFAGWGKQVISANGIDLLVDMASDYTCTVAEQNTGNYQSAYSEYIMVSDLATYSGQDFPSTYDPETGTFELAMIYYISLGNFGYGYETMVMDRPITERDTVDVTADMKIAAEPAKGIIKVSAEYEGFSYILEVVGADTVGTFSLADGTLSQQYYYGIVALDGSVKSDFTEGSVTIAKNETGLKLNGLMIGADEKAYVLDWTYTPITERDTVDVISNKMIYNDFIASNAAVQYYAGADAGYTQFCVTSKNATSVFGTFEVWADYSWINFTETTVTDIQEGQITVTEAEDGVHLTGYVIGNDEKYYRLNWFMKAGILPSDTDAPFEATFAYSDMSASIEDGVIGIYATNAENLTIGLELYADPAATTIPAGTYVISDTQEAGTALQSLGVADGYLTECWAGVRTSSGISDCWFMVEGTITLSYDEYGKLKVVVDAKNSYGRPVTALIAYEKIEPKKTVDFTDAELYVYEGYVEEYGLMNFYGGNADGYKFDLYAYADTVAGDFLEAIDFGDCALSSPAGGIGVIDAYEFKVVADGKNLTLTAKVLGADTVQYNITATGYYGALPYDTEEAYEGVFENDEVTYGMKQQGFTKYQTITGTNANGDQISIYIKANSLTTKAYSVLKSTGLDENDDPTPSYIEDANGNLWFIQSGTLNFNATEKSATFEGLNSYDQKVVFTIKGTSTTNMKNVADKVKAVKYIKNGMMVIEKNGKRINILGAAL